MFILQFRGRKCITQQGITLPDGKEMPSGADLVLSGELNIFIASKIGKINVLVGVWPAAQVEVKEAHFFVDAHDIAVYS